jgi:MscS family membrane protein
LFLRAIIQRITHNKTGEYLLFKTEAKGVAKALSLFLMTAFISFFLPILQLPILLSSVLVFILNVAMPTFAFLGLYRFVDLLSIALQYMAKSTQNPLDNQLLPLLRKTLKLIVSVVGLIYVFKAANVDLTTLIAGLSIGGLALALAAQDSVKNFLGSITILLDSTFYIGDQIEADNKSGIVEEVGFRSTKIRTTDGSIITIPNAKLIDTAIVNHGYKTYKRFTPKVIISANSGTLPIQAFTQAIQKMIDEHPQTHDIGNKVYVNNMNGRQIDIAVSVLYDVEKDEGLVREQIVLGIVQLAHQHKIILL